MVLIGVLLVFWLARTDNSYTTFYCLPYVIGVSVRELREHALGGRFGVERGAYCQRNAYYKSLDDLRISCDNINKNTVR